MNAPPIPPRPVRVRLRLLPVVVAAASLALALKVTAVGSGVYHMMQPALAASDPAETATAAASIPAPDEPPAEPRAAGDASAANGSASEAQSRGFRPPPERSRLSDAELDVLQQLTDRRQALDAREQAMKQREALLQAAEMRLDRKVEELRDMQRLLEGLIQTREEQEDQKLASLVKIYENMRPKDAARIFEQLEMDTLLLVADRMRERSLAPIMAQMNPRKAQEVTVELARLRALPQPWANAEGS
ncbi:MAG: hypothetical protein EA406_00720 [Rhodospirillales bacterium]|nr:MAG: hypothetical protein EA406_00720 [Rhodospirillales bacterium]